WPEDRVAAHMAVMRDMHVRHQEIVVADGGVAATAGGATVDRCELADGVAFADGQPRALTLVLEVLRRKTDRRHREDVRLVADIGPAVDDDRRVDAASPANRNFGTDRAVGADDRSFAEPRRGMDVRGRIDVRRARLNGEQE